jgi:hypothetical protein
MKNFSVFFLFFQLFILIFPSLSYATDKPKFVRGEKVRYLTHGGALREATVVGVVHGASENYYRISSGLVQILVFESFLRKIPQDKKLNANSRRWDLSRVIRFDGQENNLEVLPPIAEESKSTQAS